MIIGEITPDRQAVITVELRGPTGRTLTTRAVIDTGFTDALTISPGMAEELQLELQQTVEYELGDGSVVQLDTYKAIVLWDGAERAVLATATEGGSLVGMSLLYGYNVNLPVVDGGQVRIEKLA